MGKKPRHPDVQLFECLSGLVEPGERQKTEQHLAECEECASVAALIRTLKSKRAEKSGISENHPDVSELAAFFYAKSPRRDSGRVAAHVAVCGSCADEIAQYARADYAASRYEAAKAAAGEVPAKAWEMIRDWEDSGFAKLKPARAVLGRDLLNQLSQLFASRRQEGPDLDYDASRRQLVPVFVVTDSGEERGVEYFEKSEDPAGASVLRHVEHSDRFDNKLLHALVDLGEKDPVVISDMIRSDTIRLDQPAEPKVRRALYFIIED